MLLRNQLASLAVLLLLTSGCAEEQASESRPRRAADVATLENQVAGWMGQFNYDRAVQACTHLSELADISETQRQKFQVDLAIALLNRRQEGDLERAGTMLDAVAQADAKNLRALYSRALLHFHEGNTSAARVLFEQVAQADPADGYALYYVAQCLFLAGEYGAALEKFLVAQETDPYLRSAYYGAFQAAQRLRDTQQSHTNLEQFQKLAKNPRARLAELKYTRMGPKAEVSVSATQGKPRPLPDGPLFAPSTALPLTQAQPRDWQRCQDAARWPNITIADIDGDRRSDLFLANAFDDSAGEVRNAVLLFQDDGFQLQLDHPLAKVAGVNTVLWGDFDNDGQTDAFLCRRGRNQLWRRDAADGWLDVSAAAEISSSAQNTIDGACFDADHDGDLDYLLANRDGSNQLFNNNRDGSFRPIADELGLAESEAGTRQLLIADVDSDDDADIVFINDQSPHEVFVNDRFWNYRAADLFEDFKNSRCFAAAACDTNADGQVEIFTLDAEGVLQWQPNGEGRWTEKRIVSRKFGEQSGASCRLELVDIDGDAHREITTVCDGVWRCYSLDGVERARSETSEALVATAAVWQQVRGPALVSFRASAAPRVWQPGAGRHAFVQVALSGKTDKAAEMRSNASGIGVQGAARIQDRWAILMPFRSGSGPGQSLQPTTIGLAGRKQVDFLRMLWPDGVSQTELNLQPGKRIDLIETQRQAGSCPLVFVWDGSRYTFVADMLGAGGIGFNLGRSEYYEPRPVENLKLPAGLLKPQDGRYVVKLGEPMEEICYFDAVRLVAYDLPPGWEMTLDERFGAAEPLPTGAPVFFQQELLPDRATNDLGDVITSTVKSVDRVAAPLNRRDHRFIGLADTRTITLAFDQPLDSLSDPVLVFDGWVEYAYSQTAFAAWQAGEQYTEPTIEARAADGTWHTVCERFGYMAGTPRQATMPLAQAALPSGTKELRITTNMQIYWDRLAIINAEHNDQVRRHELPLRAAVVEDVGFAKRRLLDQRYPIYDYDCRPPLGDARHPAGFYTRFGDAYPLVEETDNAVAIIGPGEELHLEYELLDVPLPDGWTRTFVLEADGWCKDADLFTQDAGTVDPVPTRGTLTPAAAALRNRLHQKYNSRYRSGY